jgi:hypothetical protein
MSTFVQHHYSSEEKTYRNRTIKIELIIRESCHRTPTTNPEEFLSLDDRVETKAMLESVLQDFL